MKTLTNNEMRNVDGGASKYVYCPICGYKRKSTLIDILFHSDANIKYNMQSKHYSIGKGYVSGKSVHK